MKKLFIILGLFLSGQILATNYYVKNGGSDVANGLSDATAWATLSKVSGATFSPGDTIFLKRGSTWRELLTIHNSGSSGNYIVYTAYDTGNKPKIYGSTQAITWTATAYTNVWQSATSVTDPYAPATAYRGLIYFLETGGAISSGHAKKTYTSNFSNLTAEYDWTWNANTVYVYTTSDPDTRYTAVEVSQRFGGLNLNQKQYIKIDNIEVAYAQCRGVYDENLNTNLSGLTVSNCLVHHIGMKGDASASHGISASYSNMLIQNNEVYEIGRRSVSIYTYGTGYTISNIIVEGNTLHDGYHTTGIDCSTGTSVKFDGIIYRRNLIYDPENKSVTMPEGNTSELIFLQNYGSGGSTTTNVEIYDNIFMYPCLDGISMEKISGAVIYNNTFYGHNALRTTSTMQLNINNGCTGIVVKNNIFYGTAVHSHNPYGICIYLPSNQNPSGVTADYNLFYQEDATSEIFRDNFNGRTYTMSQWVSLKSTYKWESNSPTPTNPLFANEPGDLSLAIGSPAINAGLNVGLTTDYAGNEWSVTPSIGAYEYNATGPTLVTGITITATGGATTIAVDNATLQLYTNVEPDNATDTTKTWSIVDGTGHGTIDENGLVTAFTDGTVTVTATANDGSGITDDYALTFSNQNPTPGVGLPTVYTSYVQSQTSKTAIIHGEVIDDGEGIISARGFCWGTSANPTISGLYDSNGTGLGAFTSTVKGLSSNTTYHVRAYATNEEGTSYGADMTFTTSHTSKGRSSGRSIMFNDKIIIIR